ncbi:aldehyde dehydrogenase (NADP(+)) [Pedobacter hartonius]|uniref:NADP-dependent aldehyde dehydrogenase n=1 Tax=Pedobacter hartonius TaxID=425514 RepID=A0A1H4GQH1_9SPHI|nr:aldehyde dehydrogenase (NADP(+)) [Pedobacter hartonius]SEB11909.1 NADP-dependent aldehyde dehydrogenase [Pedobacter hartonius]
MNGQNLVGNEYAEAATSAFRAVNPLTGEVLDGEFFPAQKKHVDDALLFAANAFITYKNIDKDLKADFLRTIAKEILALDTILLERACAESGLPLGRIQGERGRTVAQLNMFADLVAEGSWVEAIIDHELPERQPAPRPDLRRMLVPLGPVVVFGASNFPLAFSVAGGDTASALASGCPVIVKAHAAHPGTSALVASAIQKAVISTGMPPGVFSMLFDNGFEIGASLVQHPKTKAVTFTGSFKGGMALTRLAAERAVPIPVFAEMGSINPILLLPDALHSGAEKIAEQYAASITMGAGQFCTNPGLLIGTASDGLTRFKDTLAEKIAEIPSAAMLTPAICSNYHKLSAEMLREAGVTLVMRSQVSAEGAQNQAGGMIAQVSAKDFIANPKLKEEIFGPWSLLVIAENNMEMEQVLDSIGGQLTVSVMAEDAELDSYQALLDKAADICGRILLNGVPTGVEVCAAMQHGGPFPATNDSRFTSVGTTAVRRFVRPFSWQNWDGKLLPAALQEENPLGIWRMVNQSMTNSSMIN